MRQSIYFQSFTALFILSFLTFPLYGQIDRDEPTKDQTINDDLIVTGSECVGFDCANGENFGFNTQRYKENNLRIGFFDTSASASFPGNDWEITINDSNNGGDNYFAVTDIDAVSVPFRVDAGARTDALRVTSKGKVGLGTGIPLTKLHLVDGDSPSIRLEQDATGGFGGQAWDLSSNETGFTIRDITNGGLTPFHISPAAPSNTFFVDALGNVGIGTNTPGSELAVMGDITATGTITSSDARLKENVKDIDNALQIINQLDAKEYYFKANDAKLKGLNLPEEKQYGFIAQELEEVLPAVVLPAFQHEGTTYKGVKYDAIIPVLAQGIKEQQTEIEDLKAEVKELKSLMRALIAKETIDLENSPLNNSQILQNHPNPFSEETTIHYFIPETTRTAVLTLSKATGEVVQSYTIQARGDGQKNIAAKDLNEGVYFYTLILDGQLSETKQMLISK